MRAQDLGPTANKTCNRSGFESFKHIEVEVFRLCVPALMPFVFLTYVMNIKSLKNYCLSFQENLMARLCIATKNMKCSESAKAASSTTEDLSRKRSELHESALSY